MSEYLRRIGCCHDSTCLPSSSPKRDLIRSRTQGHGDCCTAGDHLALSGVGPPASDFHSGQAQVHDTRLPGAITLLKCRGTVRGDGDEDGCHGLKTNQSGIVTLEDR